MLSVGREGRDTKLLCVKKKKGGQFEIHSAKWEGEVIKSLHNGRWTGVFNIKGTGRPKRKLIQ